jgi:hypothetical protein
MAAAGALGAEVEGAPAVGSSRKEEKEAAASGELRHRMSRRQDGEEGWRWRRTTKVKWGGAAAGEGRREGGREGGRGREREKDARAPVVRRCRWPLPMEVAVGELGGATGGPRVALPGERREGAVVNHDL